MTTIIYFYNMDRCVKVIDKGVAQLCFLAQDCDHDEYKTLVEALCRELEVYLLIGNKS